MQNIGIVLGGGKSSRMQRDKLTLSWDNTTLWQHAEAKLHKANMEKVYISTPKQVTLPPSANVLYDVTKNAGPIGAVQAVCAKYQTQEELNITVLPVDMPYIETNFLLSLKKKLDLVTDGNAVSVENFYFPCILHMNSQSKKKITSFIGKPWHSFLQALSVHYLPLTKQEEEKFLNINHLADYIFLYKGKVHDKINP